MFGKSKVYIRKERGFFMALEQRIGKIVEMKRIQSPGFSYNRQYLDYLVRWGFKPTDTVYDVVVEFSAGKKVIPMRIEQLMNVAKAYNVNRPRKLVGNEVECDIDGTLSAGFITAINPVKPELKNGKSLTAEQAVAIFEAQPPFVPSHGAYRVMYPLSRPN